MRDAYGELGPYYARTFPLGYLPVPGVKARSGHRCSHLEDMGNVSVWVDPTGNVASWDRQHRGGVDPALWMPDLYDRSTWDAAVRAIGSRVLMVMDHQEGGEPARRWYQGINGFVLQPTRRPLDWEIRYFDMTEARMGFGLDEPTEDPVRALLNIGELVAPMWVNVGAELDFTGPQHADKSWSHVV